MMPRPLTAEAGSKPQSCIYCFNICSRYSLVYSSRTPNFTPNTAIPVFGGVGYDLCSVYVHMIHITATAFTYFERSSKIEIWNRRTKRRNQKHPRAEKNRIRKYLA